MSVMNLSDPRFYLCSHRAADLCIGLNDLSQSIHFAALPDLCKLIFRPGMEHFPPGILETAGFPISESYRPDHY